MTNEEARFILSAYRPRGDDAGDRIFSAALAQANRDPELREWFEKQRKFDAMITERLRCVKPPASLCDAIMAGSRVSRIRVKRRWRGVGLWTFAAAVVAVALGVTLRYRETRPTLHVFASAALRDAVDVHQAPPGDSADLADVQLRLARETLPLSASLHLNFDELEMQHCRALRVNDRAVYELCFVRDDVQYHIYVARRSDFSPARTGIQVLGDATTQFACATWSDSDQIYALVTPAGGNALRRVI